MQYVIKRLIFSMVHFLMPRDILILNNLKIIYYGLVRSLISYMIIVWGVCNTTVLNKVRVAQIN